MEIKSLAKNTAILASPKVLKFAVGLLKTKLIAIFLGTTGLAVVEQITTSVSQIRRLSLSFLPDGMVKLIAEERSKSNDNKKILEIIKTYFLMIIPLTILICSLGYIFSEELTLYIFGDSKYLSYFLIGYSALPITILAASFKAFLKAFKEIKSFAKTEYYIVVLNLILFVPLVYFFQITGGVIYATLSFFTPFFVNLFIVRNNVFKKYGLSISGVYNSVFSFKYYKELMGFLGVGIIAGLFRVLELISVRSIVVNQLGIEELGIYSPITKWGRLFLIFILPALHTYLFPRLSEAKDDKEVVNVVNDVIRLLTFIVLPFIILGTVTRQWIIPLFYSKEFMDASIYLPYHFIGLLLTVWATSFEQIFAPRGKLRPLLYFAIFFSVLSFLVVYFTVPHIGLYGYMLRFTIVPLITALLFFLFWRSRIKFKFQHHNVIMIGYAILCSTILILTKDLNQFIQLLNLLLIVPLFWLLRKKERNFILKKIKLKRK